MKASHVISIAAAAATALSLGVTGVANAAVTPATNTFCTSEPAWHSSMTVNGTPAQDHNYTLALSNGTFSAQWSSAWNLAVNYHKTGGSTISLTFEYFDIYTSLDLNGTHESCGWGNGSDTIPSLSSGGTASHMFTGSAQPPAPYNHISSNGSGSEQQVIAVMNVPGQGMFAIGFGG